LTIILCTSFIRVTDCSIRVSRSFTGAAVPLPSGPGCYTYIIMIIKMIEIYYSGTVLLLLVNHAYCIETITARTSLTYLSSEKNYQLYSTCYAAVQINNCLKELLKITDDLMEAITYLPIN